MPLALVLSVARCWLRRAIDEDENATAARSLLMCASYASPQCARTSERQCPARGIPLRNHRQTCRLYYYIASAAITSGQRSQRVVVCATTQNITRPVTQRGGYMTILCKLVSSSVRQLDAVAPVARRAVFLAERVAVAVRPARAPIGCQSRRRAVWASLCLPGEMSGRSASQAEW